jgi:hypothetical protein
LSDACPLVVDDAAPCLQSPPTPWRDFARALAVAPRQAHLLYGQKTLTRLCSCIGRASSSGSPPVWQVDNGLEERVLVRAGLDVGGVQLLNVGVEVIDTADASIDIADTADHGVLDQHLMAVGTGSARREKTKSMITLLASAIFVNIFLLPNIPLKLKG